MKQIRQGDVWLVAVDKLPPSTAQVKSEVILAEGEVTGHAHRLTGQVVEWTENDQRFVRIIGQAFGKLSHEEHDPTPAAVVEPETTYRVIPQRETNLSEEWQKVVD